MRDNTLDKYVQTIDANCTSKELLTALTNSLGTLHGCVYSYLVRANCKNEQCTWQVEYLVSQQDDYNTIPVQEAIVDIYNNIQKSKTEERTTVIGFKQPPLALMTRLYEPLVRRLAIQQSHKWGLEYDDAYQMCLLVMVELYNKHYYINKWLLERSYNNYVLVSLRRNRDNPGTASLEEILYDGSEDDLPIRVEEALMDRTQEMHKQDALIQEAMQDVFLEIKDILVEMMGERQFEQFYNEYSNKRTTQWSRKKMQQVKNKLKQLGLDWKAYEKYL